MPSTTAPSGAYAYQHLLMHGKWFRQITPSLQQQLLDAAVIRKLASGERLFSRGDACCGLYAVLDGTVHAMLSKADTLLYRAKEMGRNRVCFG